MEAAGLYWGETSMVRGFFGRGKDSEPVAESAAWPQLPQLPGAPGAIEEAPEGRSDPPVPTQTAGETSGPRHAAGEAELLEEIAACRNSVADALFEASRDYQVLCHLVHESVPACEEVIAELRRRLAGNLHYTVLAKLDEAHALVEERLGQKV